MIIRLDRHEVCKVLLALTAVSHMDGTAEVFKTVHDKIKNQLAKYDEEKDVNKE